MTGLLTIDGSYGEGGGQIVRTAVSLSAITGRSFRIHRIRAGRRDAGLRPQHLTAVRAVADVCAARMEGDAVGSRELIFEPTERPRAGEYVIDVQEAAGTGSAGSATLIFQALLPPLALASGPSHLTLRGGTHVRWSPPFHYLAEVYLPTLARGGFAVDVELHRWGWYPAGGGEIRAHIAPSDALTSLTLEERGRLVSVSGVSAASNLPDHIIERQAERVVARLRVRHIKAEIALERPPAASAGTVLFLLARYEDAVAGFTGYGRVRYPAERVADDAVDPLDRYIGRRAAVDAHLADQLVVPLALAAGASTYTTSAVTRHLLTVAWLVPQFLPREITVEGAEGRPGRVTIAA
jgi:RNA 3'-terminal phosphate cyclase (ATP)